MSPLFSILSSCAVFTFLSSFNLFSEAFLLSFLSLCLIPPFLSPSLFLWQSLHRFHPSSWIWVTVLRWAMAGLLVDGDGSNCPSLEETPQQRWVFTSHSARFNVEVTLETGRGGVRVWQNQSTVLRGIRYCLSKGLNYLWNIAKWRKEKH